jgi:hypothetical protein
MTLEERLATIREQSKARMPPEVRAVLLRSIDDLRASGIMQRVAKVGSPAPEFTLPNAAGQPVSLGGPASARARGALVLSRPVVTGAKTSPRAGRAWTSRTTITSSGWTRAWSSTSGGGSGAPSRRPPPPSMLPRRLGGTCS